MDFGFTPEEEEFRTEVLEFLTDFRDLDGYFHRRQKTGEGVRRLYRALGDRGWLSLSWPEEFGGRGCRPPTSSSCGTRWRTPASPARRWAPA